MKLGVTLLFKDKNTEGTKGVLKSTVIESASGRIMEDAQNIGGEIAEHYNYTYFGINDLFTVSDKPKVGEFLGRTTYYELDEYSKSKNLIDDDFSLDELSESNVFNCSLIYFCENADDEKYSITTLTIIESSNNNLLEKALEIGNRKEFKDKVKSNSIDNIESIKFVGIESINSIDLKYDVFQSFYSDFENDKVLKAESLSTEEIEEIEADIIL